MRLPGSIAVVLVVLTGCAAPSRTEKIPVVQETPPPVTPERRTVKPITGLPLIVRLLPPGLEDRSGWAEDIHFALTRLGIEPSAQNICAVVAIAEQESGFRADPPVPGLADIASREIERRRESARIPKLVVRAALALPSSDGRSYGERLESVSTERQLSDLYEDFARRMPLPKGFFSFENPVRTAGPMQVSISFAVAHAASVPYPYSFNNIREEVFTRRGGLYFGIAHLLDYPAPYDDPVYRFADYNAGRFASRNAAFQKAVSEASGMPLRLDGDLQRATQLATLKLAGQLGMSADEIRRDLARGDEAKFERTPLYAAVFALAGSGAPRAVVPAIEVKTAKTRRRLTTHGFAKRAVGRFLACIARG